jgi:hypothetical protein
MDNMSEPTGAPSLPLRQPPAPSALLPGQPRALPHPRGRARRKETQQSGLSASTFRKRRSSISADASRRPSTTTRSIKEGTLRPGNSRNFSQKTFCAGFRSLRK